jgi:hypothetical protein
MLLVAVHEDNGRRAELWHAKGNFVVKFFENGKLIHEIVKDGLVKDAETLCEDFCARNYNPSLLLETS